MKFVKWFVIGASLAASTAFSGPNDGGGGKGFVCRDAKTKEIKSVELLDLWESREIHERKDTESVGSLEYQIYVGIQHLKHAFAYPFQIITSDKQYKGGEALAESLISTARQIHSEQWGLVKRMRGVRLKLTPDSFEDAEPDQCPKGQVASVEQLVTYKDVAAGGQAKALMNQDLVDRMDTKNKAALALHEALYAELRKFGETNSLRTRRAVGYVMNGGVFKPMESFISKPYILCESKRTDEESLGDGLRTRFYIVKQASGLIAFVPEKVDGIFPMGFAEASSGSPNSVEEEYQQILSGGVGTGGGISNSPVDFDFGMQVFYGSRTGRVQTPGDVWVKVTGTSSGIKTKENGEVVGCKLVK